MTVQQTYWHLQGVLSFDSFFLTLSVRWLFALPDSLLYIDYQLLGPGSGNKLLQCSVSICINYFRSNTVGTISELWRKSPHWHWNILVLQQDHFTLYWVRSAFNMVFKLCCNHFYWSCCVSLQVTYKDLAVDCYRLLYNKSHVKSHFNYLFCHKNLKNLRLLIFFPYAYKQFFNYIFRDETLSPIPHAFPLFPLLSKNFLFSPSCL